MELLKQSLVTNANISIHDAIIEQRQEDDTGIVSIVSPYASLGDLAQFLADGYGISGGHLDQVYDMVEKFPHATDTHQLRMSLLGQSRDLASALEFLHNGFNTKANDWKIKCAHLDLKPSNILIFESSQPSEVVGTWKLSDFGISVFGAEHLQGPSTVQLGSAGDYFMKFADTIRTSPKRIPGVYQAPEIEHPQLFSGDNSNPEHGARTSDIWSFGAIFAEVLAYAYKGASEVQRFDKARKLLTPVNGERVQNDFFYTTLEISEQMRRPSSILPCITRKEVLLWLEQFHFEERAEPRQSGVCLKCWAECVKSILEVDPHDRPSAPTLYGWIRDLHRHAKNIKSRHVRYECPGPRSPGPTRYARDDDVGDNDDDEPIPGPLKCRGILGSRARWETRLLELPLSSNDVIDYDLGGTKLVYLTKKGIDLFPVSNSRAFQAEYLHLDHGWRGIKMAGPYIVVWGFRLARGRESAVS
jgi:serine/threonine protein kinase